MPILVSDEVVEPPKAVARVTLLATVSSVAAPPACSTRRAEMSWVLAPFHCSVPPLTVMLPVVPSEPLAKLSVPAVTIVPPV